MSGSPPLIEDYNLFQEKFKVFYDRVTEKYALDMQATHVRIERYVKLLNLLIPQVVKIDLPQNDQQWLDLTSMYGPILISKEKGTQELCLVIADELT